MQQPYVLGIDIGTGSTKAVAFSAAGNVLATAQQFYGTLPSAPALSEQDPEVIWQAFVCVVQQAVAQAGAPPQGISFSSAMHSLLLLDGAGKPLAPSLTWADRRAAAVAEALRNSPQAEDFYSHTGTPVHAMSPLCKLAWFHLHEAPLLARAAKAISIKEYIWYKVFGVFEIDFSIASATGLFDINTCTWYAPALHFCGVSTAQLSEPKPTGFCRKLANDDLAGLLALSRQTSFCIGASDGCLANLGSNALDAGTAAVTLGTSGAARVATTAPLVAFPQMLFNYRLDENIFICGGAINNGGNVAQWLVQKLGMIEAPQTADYNELFEKAMAVPAGCEGLICLPYLRGERTPLWDERLTGAYLGLGPQHGQAHLVRAALEGVCFCLNQILNLLTARGQPIETLRVSGGIVHANMWLQMLADVTGKKVQVVQTEDASAIGAALLGLKAIGIAAALPASVEETFYPNGNTHEIYKKEFALFVQLSQTMQPLMHQVYEAATGGATLR